MKLQNVLAVTIILCLVIGNVFSTKPGGPKCVEECNREWPNAPVKKQVCSTWKTDHVVAPDFLTKNCYRGCELGVLYPGTCKCPSNCHRDTNQGVCSSNGCVCAENWTGPSCSISKKPENSYLNLKSLPFGDLFGDHYWSKKEKYQDNHPVFNVSRFATINLKISDYNHIHLLNQSNLFNNTWLRSDLHFDNGIISETMKDIGIRLKGSGGRIQRKKGFKLSFTSFGNSGRRFYGLRRIGFKGQQESLTGVKSLITSELYRSMSVPVQRGSFAKIYINGIYYGVYWMCEELEKSFIASRYKGSKGNLYRCFIAGFEYLGDDQNEYKKLNLSFGGKTRKFYEKKLGNVEDYSDLVHFIKILNKTSDEDFPKEIKKIFEVENYLRQLVVEISTGNFDAYTVNHNNYMIYNDSKTKKFNFISYDFDLVLWGQNLSMVDVYEWHIFRVPFPPFELKDSPLTARILKIPEFRRRFTKLFSSFLKNVFDPKKVIIQRLRRISEMLKRDVEKDMFYPLDYFAEERNVQNVEQFIESRYKYAMTQLDDLK